MNIESATLVLRTTNATIDTLRTSATWRINLRQTLGNLYNKYDRYKICLTSFATSLAPNGLTFDDVSTIAFMTGLNWENQTYDTAINGLRERAAISTLRFVNNQSTVENFTGEVGQVFIKPNIDETTINISLEKSNGAALPALGYPHCIYIFTIYGIPKDK
jgi:hypothetical protein